MSVVVIDESTKVTLNFSLTLENGDIVDSNFDKDPVTFVIGDASLLPGFERKLFGLKSGDCEQFIITPEDGFGQPNPNNIQEVPRKTFDDSFELTEGLVVSFADAAGGELPGVVREFNDESVFVDFNHPLAGRVITFKVSIVDVVAAVTH